jgi:hypothetical protein
MLAVLAPAAMVAPIIRPTSVLAADISITPTGGFPGEHLIQTMLNWLSQIALYAGGASFIGGAIVSGVGRVVGSGAKDNHGKLLMIGGAVSAFGATLAPTFVNIISAAAR